MKNVYLLYINTFFLKGLIDFWYQGLISHTSETISHTAEMISDTTILIFDTPILISGIPKMIFDTRIFEAGSVVKQLQK